MHNTRSMTVGVILFVVVVIGMFAYAYLKRSEMVDTATPQPTPTETPSTTPYDSITRIDAKHFYVNGTHTLAGEIAMPTPCDLLDWDAAVAESMPEQVTVDFTVINESEMCTQVITPQRFKVEFSASEAATIRARLNGRDVELNLVPPAPGETPDKFELFIKG